MAEPEEMTPKERTYEHIRVMEIGLESAKERWLERYGWKLSCQFVDSCWRWVKEINGERYMCDMQEAIKIERDFLE
jgi:hypothetical protein